MAKNNSKCINCNSPTTNPRFCSRSCSASYNNKAHPKRKPEGKCNKCDTPIKSQKSLCDKCNQLEKQEANRHKQNIHVFQGPNGPFEKKLPYISNSSSFVFSSSPTNLTLETSCEELIYYLLSLLTDKPEYIRPSDIRWLSAMLIHLLETKIDYKNHWNENITSISNLPIKRIASYLETWVWSFFKDNWHPLLPSFALATCQFIDAHLFGFYERANSTQYTSWKIKPWFQGKENRNFNDRKIWFLNDKQFKKEFTEKMGYLTVACTIPNGSLLTLPSYISPDVSGPANFDIEMKRCYLSTSTSDPIFCSGKESDNSLFDIFSDFEFTGDILSINGEKLHRNHLGARIPARWAIGIKHYDSELIICLPDWLIS